MRCVDLVEPAPPIPDLGLDLRMSAAW